MKTITVETLFGAETMTVPRRPIKFKQIRAVSSALRRLATAASGNLGSDCYIHAAIAQKILYRLGVESKLVVGYAAWRVGGGDSDVILHAPLPDMPVQDGAAPYHVWLEVGNKILDFTTYQLKAKAAHMDMLDGGKTDVAWCPDYLFVPKSSVSPIQKVIQLRAGLYCYARNTALEAKIIFAATPADEADVSTAWLLYQNPEMNVFGPNHMHFHIGQ